MIKLWEGVLHYLDEKDLVLLALIITIHQQYNLSFISSCTTCQWGILLFTVI